MAVVLHLMPAAAWSALADGEPITNASLDTEGFIHCTDEPRVMLLVANAFYTSVPGAFIVAHVDTDRLTSRCVWEAPAHISDTGQALAPQFPHVYGPIDLAAVIGTQAMVRDEHGAFIGYESVAK
jgi:hypothetical protein